MSNLPDDQLEGGEYEYIFRTCITLKNGKKLYAASVGKKAFRLKIRKK